MASASTPSVNEPAKATLYIVHTVKLKPILEAQIDRFSTLRENPYEEDDYDNYY